jgi:uncharacterized glyoxalase superfamily protein PhnB/uncharacterized protein YndB with AHSA1/START domain
MPAKESNTANREIKISRILNAPIELVWEVFINPDHIAQWWGPTGFSNTIHTMDIKPEGDWILTMHGPDGKDYYNTAVFKEIVPHQKIVYEHTNVHWFRATIEFESQGEKTLIKWQMLFESEKQLAQVVKTFNADVGLTQNVDKLEHYLQTRIHLYKNQKTTTMSRVSTYLNFPGNTETAFNFYRSVFGGEFGGNGITRFGDTPHPEGAPPMSEADKKLIIHVELTILGGHVIMATDAPASMGFKVEPGNNMHINLEPDTRQETKKLFDGLSKNGKITMELQDMFWGAYFGSCTDQFGVNWMFNCTEKV